MDYGSPSPYAPEPVKSSKPGLGIASLVLGI